MKIVINKSFGGTNIPLNERTNGATIRAVERGLHKNNGFEKLKVLEIPDEITDYKIVEYDGFESVYYVIDGKIHIA